MADILNIVNTIQANASTEYQSRVPLATRTNIQDIANPILAYTSVQNEFLGALVNKVALQVVQKRIWDNPLAILKKGMKPLGGDIENTYTNPATDDGYEAAGTALLTVKTPDVKAEYFRLNRKGQYAASIYREQLRQAFTSWDNLMGLIDSISNSLYSGDYIDEFVLMKSAMTEAIKNQKMITASVTAVTDAASATAFVKAVKDASSAFTYPSSSWNAYAKAGGTGNAVVTWSPKDRQVLVIKSNLINAIDVDVLSAAFNMSKVEFMGRVVEVDSFGDMASVEAILMDEATLQVWDDLTNMEEFRNPKGMYTTYFWHHWQTYAISVLSNAVAFVSDATAPAKPVITAVNAAATVIAGTGEVAATVVITNSTTGVTKTAVVAANNAWTTSGWAALVQGQKLNARQIDRAGNVSPAADEVTVGA